MGLTLPSVLAWGLLGVRPLGSPRVSRSSEEVSLWCADRGAAQLVGLDDELIVRRVESLGSPARVPRKVLAAGDGGAWVFAADGRGAGSPVSLLRVPGRPVTQRDPVDFGRARGLLLGVPRTVALAWEGAHELPVWIASVEQGGTELAVALGPNERAALRGPQLRTLAARAGRVLVASERGELILLGVAGSGWDQAPRARRQLASPARELAAAGERGWWVATEAGGLERRDSELRLLWSVATPAPGALVAAPDGAVTWIERGGRRLWRLTEGPHWTEGPVCPLGGLVEGRCDGDGRLSVALPGVILTWTGAKSWERFQGGFEELVDLDLRPPFRDRD